MNAQNELLVRQRKGRSNESPEVSLSVNIGHELRTPLKEFLVIPIVTSEKLDDPGLINGSGDLITPGKD
ncbi:MAG: hypothetical protein IPG53_21565 [Ignavibacteriales bacterium]|nr:hypothetical protein [Ignavibacteriales bacterium]